MKFKLKDIVNCISYKDKCKICVVNTRNKFVEAFLGCYDKKVKDYANAYVIDMDFFENIIYIRKN